MRSLTTGWTQRGKRLQQMANNLAQCYYYKQLYIKITQSLLPNVLKIHIPPQLFAEFRLVGLHHSCRFPLTVFCLLAVTIKPALIVGL